jgi:hypothetical protein
MSTPGIFAVSLLAFCAIASSNLIDNNTPRQRYFPEWKDNIVLPNVRSGN